MVCKGKLVEQVFRVDPGKRLDIFSEHVNDARLWLRCLICRSILRTTPRRLVRSKHQLINRVTVIDSDDRYRVVKTAALLGLLFRLLSPRSYHSCNFYGRRVLFALVRLFLLTFLLLSKSFSHLCHLGLMMSIAVLESTLGHYEEERFGGQIEHHIANLLLIHSCALPRHVLLEL